MDARIKCAETLAATQKAIIQDIQLRDEKSKEKEEELALRVEYLEAQLTQLKAHLGVVTEALGLEISVPPVNIVVPPAQGTASTSLLANLAPAEPTAAGGRIAVKLESSVSNSRVNDDIRVSQSQGEWHTLTYQ